MSLSPELPVTQVIQRHFTRRRIIAGTAALATAGTGLALATDRAGAQAEISTDGLAIEDAEFDAPEPPAGVFALIAGEWAYRVDADPDVWETYLLIYGDSGNSEAIAIDDGAATAREDSGTFALRGNILNTSFYTADDFTPDGGEPVVLTIAAEVAFVVRDAGGEMLIQERAADSATVTANPGGTLAQVGGTGEIQAQMAGEPTPEV